MLREGSALVTQTTKDGEKKVRRLEEYACFGERALLTSEPRHANVIAETKVTFVGRGTLNARWVCKLTLLGPQSRFGDTLLTV